MVDTQDLYKMILQEEKVSRRYHYTLDIDYQTVISLIFSQYLYLIDPGTANIR